MKAVALSHQPKKPKSCYTCSLLLGICLVGPWSLIGAQAEEISAPPAVGSHTRDEQTQPQKRPPDLPSDAQPSDDSRNLPKPEVTIIHEKDKTVEEYRVGGKIRYIKITPSKGPPYYLVDRDGDGVPETYYSPLKGPPPINQWLLLKW